MVKTISILTAMSAAFLCNTAFSAPVGNLKVAGDIKPPTCVINGGDSDLLYGFGDISPSFIPQSTTYNDLPSLSQELTVECDASTYLTFKATDNYPNAFVQTPGMDINYRTFVFNLVNATDTSKTIGGISYEWKNVTIDGQAAYISRANDGYYDNGTWSRASLLVKDATNGWTSTSQIFVAPKALNLRAGKLFSATLSNLTGVNSGVSTTYIHSKALLNQDSIDISEGMNYLGQAVLTFNFGI